MNRTYQNCRSGFTLIEILVVVAIICILSLVVLFSVSEARMVSRDVVRENTAEQLKLAVRLFKEATGDYPVSTTLTNITPATDLGLLPYIKGFQDDPMASIAIYGYYYDSSFNCTQAGQRVILVRTLERHEGNLLSVCDTDVVVPSAWDKTKVFVTIIN